MKEETMYRKWNENKDLIIQNNQMIGGIAKDTRQLQEMFTGIIGILRKLPGYDEAIKELAKEHEEKEAELKAKALAEAKETCNDKCDGCLACKPEPKIENLDPIEGPKLDLGKDN